VCPTIERIAEAGIPVMGHIGLTPQSIHALSGYGVQGKEASGARRLLEDARLLERAGCFAIVLECLPWSLAREVTEAVAIPTIGIGAGAECSGQVLVLADLLGMSFGEPAKFVKQYADVGAEIRKAIQSFASEVRENQYPDRDHAYLGQTKAAG